MASHSSTPAWKIPWTEEPGRLQSMGLRRVGHYWAISLSLFTFMHWRRKWQPTPVFLAGESRGWGAWWAAVYGVAQSRTRLKRLSSSSSRAETCIDVASSWWCVVGVSHTGCTTTCLILPSDWNQAKGCFYLLLFILPRWMELLVAPNFLSA